MNPHCTTNDDLSWNEAAELLAEIRLVTESSPQPNPYEFAGLLSDLLSLRQHYAEGGESDADLSELVAFISSGLAELRAVLDAEQPSFERIDQLSEQAAEHWGEQLIAIREHNEVQSDANWGFPAVSPREPATQEADELVAPSADAIHALMSRLAAGSAEATSPISGAVDKQDCSTPSNQNAGNTADNTAEPPAVEVHSDPEIESLDPELREAFMDDASSCLGSMENALLRLESNPQDAESLNQILRELHTLKGASGSVGLSLLAEQIHRLEDSLRDDQTAGREPSIDRLLRTVDQIRSQIAGGSSTPDLQVESKQVAPAVIKTAPPADTTPLLSEDNSDDELVRVKSSQLNRLMDMLVELVMLRNQRETELADLQEVYHDLITSVSKMRLLSNEGDLRADASHSLQLSEVASDVLETAQHLRDCTRPFADGNAAVSRFIRQFRQELADLRRTPVSGLFRRLQRVVRDAARTESKQVRLTLLGEDAGIERSLQQRLYEPLLHIVRNSVCHGIETPEQRLQCGKAPEGVVSLEARSGPDLFVIEVRDDGRGLDYEAIRRRGVERGLLAADQAASREELSQLIFHPGFSTRESANQAGGRGVGMDVVASTLKRMRGWLKVESEPGGGTRIRLSFPLPSVIQHAMVFRSANQLFALPMESVLAAGNVSSGMPQANFARLLGLDKVHASESKSAIVVANDYKVPPAGKASSLALFVDEILGPEELVVRPLPSLLKNHPYCVGASLSGMGHTVLLLDARRVLQSQTAPLSNARQPSQPIAETRETKPCSKQSRVLVVDDSVSARKRVVRSLSRYPLEIVEATNGKDALELLNKGTFAAVFSDMEMPNIDGMELLAEIHSPERSEPPPVVIISSRSESEYTDRARKLGAADYLIKPLADAALDAALRKITTLSHLSRSSDSGPASPGPAHME